jgi:hypothetical protein
LERLKTKKISTLIGLSILTPKEKDEINEEMI